jgi:hypothetical protein
LISTQLRNNGVLGLFTWLYILNNSSNTDSRNCNSHNSELPKVSENEISSYLAITPENIQTDLITLAGIEDADMDEFRNEIKWVVMEVRDGKMVKSADQFSFE